ncbi:unnamed protein product [Miscanthus lutarioriparius]|uniref:DUF1618 domain-containing protein n=1 Tax=Miscanthus lutarioriparius TaxID=422564 RepID=A0A811SJ10_9POAL|nr:unnamed protein product [Miscanthus lutarioriparius]
METLTDRGPSDPTAAAPRWVLLNRTILKDSRSSAADAKTTAASCTSSGLPFCVSFSIAAPPERSSFLYDLLAGIGSTPSSDNDKDTMDLQLQIVAAHDDSVLIESRFDRDKDARQVPTRSAEARNLSLFNDTCILRLGDGEVLVAQLEVGYDALYCTAELCVLRPGHDWVLKRLPIVHHEGEGELRHPTRLHPLRHVGREPQTPICIPLPVPPPRTRYHSSDRPDMLYCRNLAAAGPGAVRLVSVAPRSGPGKTSCERSTFAFNVTTWTLTLRTEEAMVWVKDGVLDCDELWQLPNYGHLPRVAPTVPHRELRQS